MTIQQAFQLALQHHQNGRLPEAEAIYRQILSQQPNHADSIHLLGVLAHQAGRHVQAADLIQRAIGLQPNETIYHLNLATVLRSLGRLDDAIAAYRNVIRLNPNLPDAHNNLGNILKDQGRTDEAIAAFRAAIALQPNHAEAQNNLGAALADQGKMHQALQQYQRAVELAPNWPYPRNNLAIALKEIGRLDEAVDACRATIRLDPNLGPAYNNLGSILLDQGLLDDSIAAFVKAVELDPHRPSTHSNLVYTIEFHPDADQRRLEEQRRWNQQHAQPLARFIQPHLNNRDPQRRLRVGYVSPDLREHAVGRFLLPLLSHHNHEQFEIIVYSAVIARDELTGRLRACADQWHDIVPLSDDDAAETIRRHGIDILIDLTLHMARNRLPIFARKPAPVQATYLAYAGSSGLAAMDYRISDPHLDPSGRDESCYSEQTIRLPRTYWCYEPLLSPDLRPPPHLQRGFITFGCLNNFCKTSDGALAAWAAILRQVPQSRLLLHAQPGSHRQRVMRQLQDQRIDPARITFAPMLPAAAYFEQYQAIDIALDPFPYCGGTTSCDALWMGVPLITLAGQRAVGRGGVSILHNIALGDLIANSTDQYIAIATSLAIDPSRLQQLRSTLRQRMASSPVMNAPAFAADMEQVYRQMWQTWCDKTN